MRDSDDHLVTVLPRLFRQPVAAAIEDLEAGEGNPASMAVGTFGPDEMAIGGSYDRRVKIQHFVGERTVPVRLLFPRDRRRLQPIKVRHVVAHDLIVGRDGPDALWLVVTHGRCRPHGGGE